ncbi:DUF2197 domain-containing protein [Roseivirga sp. BDSF3-8]
MVFFKFLPNLKISCSLCRKKDYFKKMIIYAKRLRSKPIGLYHTQINTV